MDGSEQERSIENLLLLILKQIMSMAHQSLHMKMDLTGNEIKCSRPDEGFENLDSDFYVCL